MRRLLLTTFLITSSLVACDASHEASAAGEVGAPSEIATAIAQSDELKAAQDAIDRGHPWRATQLVSPLLRNPQKRTPAALIVAARAAAGWSGWPVVEQLLANEPWIDTQFQGEARELLTRSALERDADTVALSRAAAALRDATTADARATRTVLLARALERNNLFDSAAVLYTRATNDFKPIRSWLMLRVAGNESDSARRAKAFASVSLSVAEARVAWTDAQARERFKDALGAATRYASLGAPVIAFRLRLSVAPDSASRDAIKDEVLTYIRTHPGTADTKTAVDVLDKAFTSFAPSEELVIARAIANSGPVNRAATAFSRALARPEAITANDRLLYGQVLARAGRSRDALAQLATVEGPLAGQAAYQRARVLMTSGTGDATRAALRDVVSKFSNDTATAAAALFLLADLTSDASSDGDAQAVYRELYRNYPTSSFAAGARFRAAILELIGGNARSAALAFDSLTARYPRSDDATAARYWSGRAWAAAENDSVALARWREIVAQSPTSYYAIVSAKRLGQKPWEPAARADSFPHVAAVDSAFRRAAILERLGMDAEARFEYDAIDAAAVAAGVGDRLLATAQAFLEHGQPSRAMRLAQRAADAGQRDARVYRLLFPVIDRDELARNAKARALDPALVAGLIRQESNFTARAVSVAGARGLMQILPSVGEEIGRSLGFPVWNSALLFDPDANLQMGTAHLATYTKQYGPLPRVLAAYNAGGSRVTRWAAKSGVDDPEMFVERIPFVETRDYVRLVQRNAEFYRMLYPW